MYATALDRLVAARVAVVIVERLEEVDVDLEQGERTTALETPPQLVVDRDVAGQAGERAGRESTAAPLQMALDPHDQLARLPRLGDVVVGPALEPDNLVLLGGLGGEHDDGQVAGGQRLAQPPARLVAIHLRHHDVEQHDVGRLRGGERHRLLAVAGLGDLEARGFQLDPQDFPKVGLVLGHQDSGLGHARLGSMTAGRNTRAAMRSQSQSTCHPSRYAVRGRICMDTG